MFITSKLLVEARPRSQFGNRTVEMSKLIEILRDTSPVKKPTYAAKFVLFPLAMGR